MIKLSDYIFKFIKDQGVKHIFMLPGGGAMHLVDSLGTSNIEFTCCQHEQAVAIVAESYAQHTNHLGVALVTSGPGATNAITGVTAGWIDSTPMLILSGQAKRQDLIGNKGVRQIGSQEVTIVDMVEPITKYAVQVLEPYNIRYILEKAYHEATTGRKGPVWIDIPLDVQAAMLDETSLQGYVAEEEKYEFKEGLKTVVEMLPRAKKPLILAGNGIISANAVETFYKVINKLNIPVQTTWKSIDIMWDKHPLYAGHPGGLGDRGANYIIQECDLLLAIGARLDNSITAFNEAKFAPNATKVVVDIDRHELDKFTMTIDVPIQADCSEFLRELDAEILDNKNKYSDWIAYCKKLRETYPVILPEYALQKRYVNGYYFTKQLSDALTSEDIIVPESAGVTAEVTIQAFENKKGQKMKHAAGLGSMGFGLPYSIGACLANQKRRTILINGDGAFQLNIQELVTVQALNLPVKIFIWNNNGYASIRAMQRNNFDGRYVASEKNSGLVLPDISKVAEAYGIKTYCISSNAEVKEKIAAVLAEDGPVLCEVMVSPDEVVSPKVKASVGKNGEMIAGELDKMWPFLEKKDGRI